MHANRRQISFSLAQNIAVGMWSLILTAAFVQAAEQPAKVGPPFVLGTADTMEKVFRDEPWTRPAAVTLAVEAARNEVEGIQLIVVPPEHGDVRSATVDVTDLVSDTGGSIPAANVTWRLVGYVETEKPAYPTDKVGWWPDPLLPPRRFDVESGHVQPVWIDVRVPADAQAGVYRGCCPQSSPG